jgi:hypothetical protein
MKKTITTFLAAFLVIAAFSQSALIDGKVIKARNGLQLGSKSVTAISDDSLLTSGSTSKLVTEGAVKRYIDNIATSYINVKKFGAKGDGTTNDRNAIQSALDAVAASGGGTIYFPDKTYKLNSGITWNATLVSIVGTGTQFDFSGQTTGASIDVIRDTTTRGNDGFAQIKNSSRYLEGIYFKGPGANVTAVKLFNFNETYNLLLPSLSGIQVRNGGASSYYIGAYYKRGAFNIAFNTFSFGQIQPLDNVNTAVAYPVYIDTAGLNGGERQNFTNCYFGGSKCVATILNFTTVFFENCSFDYCDKFFYTEIGSVHINNSHLESNRDVDYWFEIGTDGINASISIANSDFVISGEHNNYELGNNNSTNGGIFLTNITFTFGSNLYKKPFLIGGSGRVLYSQLTFKRDEPKIPISKYNNLLAFADVENVNLLLNLQNVDTSTTKIDSINQLSGNACIRISTTTINATGFSYSIPIDAGQIASINLFYKTNTLAGTGASFYVEVKYTDAVGNQIGATSYNLKTTNTSSYSNLSAYGNLCPTGAIKAVLTVLVFGRTSGNPTVYIDDIVITKI